MLSQWANRVTICVHKVTHAVVHIRLGSKNMYVV